MKVHHLNCVSIHSAFGSAIGHCILMEHNKTLTLIDAGIGLAETKDPVQKLGKQLVEITGFQFDESLTAIKQIEKLGLNPGNVRDIICSHLDPDHIGGTVDFPEAKLHVSKEEFESFNRGNDRYLNHQLSHYPEICLYDINDSEWFGLPARKLNLSFEAYLIPLFGHTIGHCGVAYKANDRWTLYVGDAYYLRAELEDKNHPVDKLATVRAADNALRMESLDNLRKLIKKNGAQLEYFSYHDPTEFKETKPVVNNIR